ncbi:MAG: lipoprotein [Pseudomonadota bacterium]
MKIKFPLILFSLCLMIGISACGNKGPLTHPEDEDEQKTERSNSNY